MPLRARTLLLAAVGLLAAGTAVAQVKYPPRPDRYHVDLRYRIRTDRDERIRQYRAMTAGLNKLGFEADPREDADLDVFDPTAERLSGSIPAANALKLLDDPRVQTILLVPAGTTLPEDVAKPVPVRITLRSGLEPAEQRLLHRQVVVLLGRMGFVENFGYDHRGFTVVRGALPAGRVPLLLKDLRDQPGGWFTADAARDELPQPLRSVLPVRVAEVLPEVEGLAPLPPSPPVVGKFTPDLRTALGDPAVQGKTIRVEAVLAQAPIDGGFGFRGRVRQLIAGSAVEGVAGSVASVRLATTADLDRLATLPEVIGLRLPRPAVATVRPAVAKSGAEEYLRASRVGELHALGYRGAGTRVVVISDEYPGLAGLVGKELPKATRVVDLTAELSPMVEPAPAGQHPLGGGVEAAVAAHAAAPDAELLLVRIDPAAFHQLLTVARHAAGVPGYSLAVQARGLELIQESEDLATRRERVLADYREAFADLSDEEKAVQRREAAQKAVAQLRADEQAFRAKNERLAALRTQLDRLAGAAVVVNTLVWEAGYPHDGLSTVSQFLGERFVTTPTRTGLAAERLPAVPVWVQAGSESAGSVWAGPFLDADGNGVMEFAPEGVKTPAGTWTAELNFLTAIGPDGRTTADLPAGARLRFTIQWREPLPPDPRQASPVFAPALRLLRQLDPAGAKAASDEFAEVARSVGHPVRIQTNPASAVFEQTLEVVLPAAGRYALRVEGRTTVEATLPALSRTIEVQPRLFVRQLAPASGRVGFATFAPTAAGVGVPGDSPGAVTVGAGDWAGGLTGAGPGVTLRAKPDVLAPGVIVVGGKSAAGSGVAAGYVAGTAASVAGAGGRLANLSRSFGLPPGGRLVLPTEWLQALTPRPAGR